MNAASPISLSFSALGGALLVSAAVSACGAEAAPPDVMRPNGGQSTSGGSTTQSTAGSSGSGGSSGGGSTVVPMGGSSGAATGGSSQAGSVAGGSAGGGGSGGTSGTSAGGAGGAATDLVATVGGPLDGQMLLGPCGSNTATSVCQTAKGACPPANASDPALSGAITTDNKVTLGGESSKTYTITLHVQGEVESKRYDGGKDQESQATSPKMDGFCEGGTPSSGDAYNVYMLRVSNPKKDYFFNSLQKPGVSNHTTYGIDYTAKIQANGGAELRLIAADSNCSMIKNCGPMENNGEVCAAPITLANIDPKAKAKNPTFNFDTAYNGQWVAMVVTGVTAN